MKYPKRKSVDTKIREVISCDDEKCFQKIFINDVIGFGIFSTRSICQGEPLLKYRGDYISKKEADERIVEYQNSNIPTCFIYELSHMGFDMCVDATNSDGIGKYVNDSSDRYANCTMKKIVIDNEAHLILYSVKPIAEGVELRYNYGQRNDWRQKGEYAQPFDVKHVNTLSCKKKQEDIVINRVDLKDSLKVVGRGSTGTVHKYINCGKTMALKVFSVSISERKLSKMAEKLCKLDHENVVKYFGCSLDPQGLLMEYCSYEISNYYVHNVKDLVEEWAEEGKKNLNDRLNIIYQSGKGLLYLHDRGIVHRDLKPANLLITYAKDSEEFCVKLCDFDDMCIQYTTTVTKKDSNFKGCTMAYTANEICLRQSIKFSLKTDTYSWAMTAYEILSELSYPWAELFPNISEYILCEALRKNERPDLNLLSKKYTGVDFIKNIIASCWHYDPDKRTQLSQDILSSLKTFFSSKSVEYAGENSKNSIQTSYVANTDEVDAELLKHNDLHILKAGTLDVESDKYDNSHVTNTGMVDVEATQDFDISHIANTSTAGIESSEQDISYVANAYQADAESLKHDDTSHDTRLSAPSTVDVETPQQETSSVGSRSDVNAELPGDDTSNVVNTCTVIVKSPEQSSLNSNNGADNLGIPQYRSPTTRKNDVNIKSIKKRKMLLKNFVKKSPKIMVSSPKILCKDKSVEQSSLPLTESEEVFPKKKKPIKNILTQSNQIEDIGRHDQKMANDSGLYGDFPSILNTDESDNNSSNSLHNSSGGQNMEGRALYLEKDISSDETLSSDDGTDSEYEPEEPSSTSSDELASDEETELETKLKKSNRKSSRKERSKKANSKNIVTNDSVTETINEIQKKLEKNKLKCKKVKEKKDFNDPFEFSEDSDDVSDNEEEESVYVPLARKTHKGCRIYDKTHCCLFCQKMDQKMARHLQKEHAEKRELLEVSKYDKEEDAEKRKMLLAILRHKGDFYHNAKVLQTGGMLIVARRPASGTGDPNNFVPCKFCLLYVSRKELSRHCKTCPHRLNSDIQHDAALQKQCDLLLYPNIDNPGCSLELQEFVLRKMKKDEITQIVSNDFLILSFGSFLWSGKGQNHSNYISEHMRILARLVQQLRTYRLNSAMESKYLMDFLKPSWFDDIVAATKEMAGYTTLNSDGLRIPEFKIPSLPLKIGYALNNVASLLQGIALRNKNEDMEKDAISFQKLYSYEWSVRVSSASLRKLADNKFNKTEHLPLTEDLMKVRQYCMTKISILTDELKNNPSLHLWRELAEVLVTRLTIFNKRRGNEVSSLLIKKFKNKNSEETSHDAIGEGLTPLEKKLKERLDLCYVRGKGGRQVPILLPPAAVPAIQVLLDKRSTIGVHSDNIYVFAAPTRGSTNPLQGYQCIAAVVNKVPDLKKPNYIKSTKLRKYVATVAQIVDLRNNELEWLANHLGHNLDVHKEYYRLRDSTLELAKVSKLLLAIDGGNGKNLAGKRFEDINIEDIPFEFDTDNEEEEGESCNSLSKAKSTVKKLPLHEPKSRKYDAGNTSASDVSSKNNSRYCKEANVELEKIDFDKHVSTSKLKRKAPKRMKIVGKERAEAKETDTVGEFEAETDRLESPAKKKRKTWTAWTISQRKLILEEFHSFIIKKAYPGKQPCTLFLEKHCSEFPGRKWSNVKDFVRNYIAKLEKAEED